MGGGTIIRGQSLLIGFLSVQTLTGKVSINRVDIYDEGYGLRNAMRLILELLF
jgi:hypothetical protein